MMKFDASVSMMSGPSVRTSPDANTVIAPGAQRFLEGLYRVLKTYHRHRVIGISHFPKTGPVVLAVNHSLASYDILLLAGAVYEETGRVPRALGDQLIFKIPYLAAAATAAGIAAGSPAAAQEILRERGIVMVAPGGMLEALRSRALRHTILWDRRKGFAREALLANAPVVLAACPRADELYEVYDNPLTRLAYEKFRVPVPLLRGLGPTLLPRPIRLVHHVSEPIFPPELGPSESEDERLQRFHATLVLRMRRLMAAAA